MGAGGKFIAIVVGLVVSASALAEVAPWKFDPKSKIASHYDLLELSWAMEEAGLFTYRVNEAQFIPEFEPIEQFYSSYDFRRGVAVVSGIHANKDLDLVPLTRGILLNIRLNKKELGLVFMGWSDMEIRQWHREFLLKRAKKNASIQIPSRLAAKFVFFGYTPRACAADDVKCEMPLSGVTQPLALSQFSSQVQGNESAVGISRCSVLAAKGAANAAYLPYKMVKEGVEQIAELATLEGWTKLWNKISEAGSNVLEYLGDVHNRIGKSMANFKNVDPELIKIVGCIAGGQLAAFAAMAATGAAAWRVAKELGVVALLVEQMGPMLAMLSNLIRQGKIAVQDTVGAITKYLADSSKTFKATMEALASQPARVAAAVVQCTM